MLNDIYFSYPETEFDKKLRKSLEKITLKSKDIDLEAHFDKIEKEVEEASPNCKMIIF